MPDQEFMNTFTQQLPIFSRLIFEFITFYFNQVESSIINILDNPSGYVGCGIMALTYLYCVKQLFARTLSENINLFMVLLVGFIIGLGVVFIQNGADGIVIAMLRVPIALLVGSAVLLIIGSPLWLCLVIYKIFTGGISIVSILQLVVLGIIVYFGWQAYSAHKEEIDNWIAYTVLIIAGISLIPSFAKEYDLRARTKLNEEHAARTGNTYAFHNAKRDAKEEQAQIERSNSIK